MGSGDWIPKAILAVLVFLLILVTFPWIQWRAGPSRTIDIAIIDKTVPDTTYRGHKGLSWILNHQKIVDRDGYNYVNDESYFGFNPNGINHINSLPSMLRGKDLIYAADTYGVYEQGQKQEDGSYEQRLVYGGMKLADVQKIQYATATGTTFIGEYNILGEPTSEGVKEQLHSMLGVNWTGWKGKLYTELATEVPVSIMQDYSLSSGKDWTYSGEGILFANEKGDIVVLDKEDLGPYSFGVEFTEKGIEWGQMKGRTAYYEWFDIVEPRQRAEVLAEYTMKLTDSGEDKLKAAGIPVHFPAITRFNHTTHYSYYFAGDYADRGVTPYPVQYKGWDRIKRIMVPSTHKDAFYWDVYIPVMERILWEIEQNS
ncbi:hypothetical protein [Paenibacillus sp. Marseille-Q4541]|uniref:hypothetical protein n=1 Tax=Paenibacillus sp. Marseille-Q4541 TaxID=2831522 RepID=UPI001BA8A124|nr:hypothetical protein [Paenibacillus sp. Marseille-Q4541]